MACNLYLLQKRGRGDADEKEEAVHVLKGVGQAGKGLVRSIYSLKVPKLDK